MDGKVVVVTGALGALGSMVVEEALARGARIASTTNRNESTIRAEAGPDRVADHLLNLYSGN